MKKILLLVLVGMLLLPLGFSVGIHPPISPIIDDIDIGDPVSEAGHNLKGWGPIEPATHGGYWGGIDDCRVVWYPGDKRWATVTFTLPSDPRAWMQNIPRKIKIVALDGIADDSFKVLIKMQFPSGTWTDWTKIYKYNDQYSTETWVTHNITGFIVVYRAQKIKIKIVATGPQWTWFTPYGQLAIDYIALER